MANMGYCRFYNTAEDLRDCRDHLLDELSSDEAEARLRLIRLCREIVREADDSDIEARSPSKDRRRR